MLLYDLCRNCAHLGSVFASMTGCILLLFSRNISRVGFFPSAFYFRIFDRISEIAAFRFLILIYFMDYSSDVDDNFPYVCAGVSNQVLITACLALSAQRRRRSHETAQPCSLDTMQICCRACSPSATAARGLQPGDWPLC